ncbi:MAG TPA: hypothetical protein VIF15_02060, partial [Polyangiaceae bacterium]
MSLNEVVSYGVTIMGMDPAGGPKPRDVLNQYLYSTSMGAKLTAAGSYYTVKRSEAAPVIAIDGDKTPIPKCAPDDQCNWSCDVPKAPGSQDKETKVPTTVGEFVKYCIEPNLTAG